MHVLIVEDKPLVARAMSRAIRGAGHAVTIAYSPEEAEIAQHHVDIILTDWSVGGDEVIRRALRPVVIHSASDIPLAGVPIVFKPAPVQTIIETLEAELCRSSE